LETLATHSAKISPYDVAFGGNEWLSDDDDDVEGSLSMQFTH